MVKMVDGHKVEFMISSRGRIKLIVDDYPFCQNEVQKKKIYYICCQTKVLKCPARLKLVKLTNEVELQNLSHNHPIMLGRRPIGEVQRIKQQLSQQMKVEKSEDIQLG